ncbi:ankyrin [Parathielavia appendiculata]|uniref:Ankyrin n=1 Tax=Parathielavia appendiculata TaxID=2587402 RepID=A0AAN6YZH3_9PEZI|nr:ankyrin [Parathielavia appendiculata]
MGSSPSCEKGHGRLQRELASHGIAGLLPLIAKAIKGAKDCRGAVVSSKDTIAALISELKALQFNINNLRGLLKDDTLSSGSIMFSRTSVLLSCSSACEPTLQSLCRKSGQQDNGRRSRYLWPLSEKEHQKTVQGIRNFSHRMHLALSVDGCRLLSQTSDDVLKVLDQQLDHYTYRSGTQKHMMENSLAQHPRDQVLDWISTVKYGQKHQALQASRAKDTGHWILRTSECTRWRDGQERDQSNVLQFLDQLPTIPGLVSSVYNDTHLRGQLPQSDCERLFAALVKLGRAYLVVDALDESSLKHRSSALRTLRHLSQFQGLRLLVTSRPHTQDIAATFAHHPRLNISAQEEDIRVYIHQELQRNGLYDVADDRFVGGMVHKLTAGTDGIKPNIGMESLMYLAHAVRPLTVHELSDVLAIHSGDNLGNNAKYRPSESMILQCCQGLITIDTATKDVRVAHHSIQEQRTRSNSISRTARFWVTPPNPEVHGLSTDLFSSTSAITTANQVRQYSVGRREEYWSAEECLSLTPLHFACRHGLAYTVLDLLDRGVSDINVRTNQGATPIIYAASNGHVPIVRVLMERGADPYLCNWYGNALHCAIESGSADAVRELVVRGRMDPSRRPPGYKPYLSCAFDQDSAEVSRCCMLEPLFLEACRNVCPRIVDLMIEHDWINLSNMRSEIGQMALYLAAERRDLDLVKRLVQAGADVHSLADCDDFVQDWLLQHYPRCPYWKKKLIERG